MNRVKIEQKSYKTEKQCYMCGDKKRKVIVIISLLHGFIICKDCAADLKDAVEEFNFEEKD